MRRQQTQQWQADLSEDRILNLIAPQLFWIILMPRKTVHFNHKQRQFGDGIVDDEINGGCAPNEYPLLGR